MIKIFIGPNGFGKTTKLQNIKEDLISVQGIPESEILFLESEILLSDEMKDTKDETKTMEYILSELLETPTIQANKQTLEQSIDTEINNNISLLNGIVDDILNYNGQVRKGDFIGVTKEKQYKKLVKINNSDFLKKTGSGQRMQLILGFVKHSSKKYIFLDEPEKYSHPSLLNVTAKMINGINQSGKDIYIATHSPKLLSMLELSIDNIGVINDISHSEKTIDFNAIIKDLSSILPIQNFREKEKSYYDFSTCERNIKSINYRDFLESLFTKQVYLCEGINDKLFLQKYLMDNKRYYDDYYILPVYGKYLLPLFISIYKSLNISVTVLFDKDNENTTPHKEVNEYIKANSNKYYAFTNKIEEELNFTSDKSNQLAFFNHLETILLPFTKYNI